MTAEEQYISTQPCTRTSHVQVPWKNPTILPQHVFDVFMLSSHTRMQIHIFLTYSCENAVSKVFSVKTLSRYFFKLILNRRLFSIFLHFSYTKRNRCICYTLLSVVFYFIRIFWIDGCIAFVGLLKALIFLNNAGYSDRVGRNYGRELKEKKSRFS